MTQRGRGIISQLEASGHGAEWGGAWPAIVHRAVSDEWCVVEVVLPVGPLLGVDAGVGVVVGHGTRELDHVGGDAVVRGGRRGGHGGATGGRRGGRRGEVIIHCHTCSRRTGVNVQQHGAGRAQGWVV